MTAVERNPSVIANLWPGDTEHRRAVAGAGMDIGQYLVIDGRYVWGLTNIDRSSTADLTVHSRVLTFMAGVRF